MSNMLPYYLATCTDQTRTIYQSFMHDLQHDPDMAIMLDKMPVKSDLKGGSGPLINYGSTYTLLDLPKMYFIGCGDIDKVEKLLKSVPFIGKEKWKGHGQVAAVNIWSPENPLAATNKWFGIIGSRNGRDVAFRPIPIRLKDKIALDIDFITSSETWHNPYHRNYPTAVVEPCMTPPFVRGESFTEYDIENELCRLT